MWHKNRFHLVFIVNFKRISHLFLGFFCCGWVVWCAVTRAGRWKVSVNRSMKAFIIPGGYIVFGINHCIIREVFRDTFKLIAGLLLLQDLHTSNQNRLAVNYFRKKLHLRCLPRFWIRPLLLLCKSWSNKSPAMSLNVSQNTSLMMQWLIPNKMYRSSIIKAFILRFTETIKLLMIYFRFSTTLFMVIFHYHWYCVVLLTHLNFKDCGISNNSVSIDSKRQKNIMRQHVDALSRIFARF